MAASSKGVITLTASLALVATLGLAACGGTAAQGDAGEATSEATASDSSVAKYDLTSVWVGMGEDTMAYYYEGSSRGTGALLIYHTDSNTYERWVGAMETSGDGTHTITDADSGEALAFTVVSIDGDGAIEVETADGFTAQLSPTAIDEVGTVLDDVAGYATRVGEEPVTPSTAELGGTFLVRINTEGLGQVSYMKDGESLGYGDSAFTHADAGDQILLSAQAQEGWAFVKWTRDGADLSNDAEVEITVEGDAEYVAVFEAE